MTEVMKILNDFNADITLGEGVTGCLIHCSSTTEIIEETKDFLGFRGDYPMGKRGHVWRLIRTYGVQIHRNITEPLKNHGSLFGECSVVSAASQSAKGGE